VNFVTGGTDVRYDKTRLEVADIETHVRQSEYGSAGEALPKHGGPAPDLTNRRFTGDGQKQLRAADMTNLSPSSDFIFLAMAGNVRAVSAA
jgi:hypothetical protein